MVITFSAFGFGLPVDCHRYNVLFFIGKKYDKPLRTLNELCDVAFNSGINLLKYYLDFVTNKKPTRHSFVSAFANAINRATRFDFGSFDLPVACSLAGNACCGGELKFQEIVLKDALCTYKHSKHLDTTDALEKVDRNDVFQKGIANVDNSFLSDLKRTNISSPVSDMSESLLRLDSYVNIPSIVAGSKNSVDGPGCGMFYNGGASGALSEGSLDSFKDALENFSSKSSTPDSLYTKVECTRSISVVSTESSFSDVPESLKYSKVSLLSLRKRYSFLPHAVFSLLVSRPLIVLGEEKHRKKVQNIVYGLGNFVVRDSQCLQKINPWMTEMIKLNELGTIVLCGMDKGIHHIPNSIKPYVSVWDYEKETLTAPPYSGRFLADMFDTNKTFSTESSYRKFIQQTLTEIGNVVYVQFAVQYAQSGKYGVSNIHGQRIYSDVHVMERKLLLGDSMILRQLVEKLREQIFSAVSNGFEDRLEMVITKPKPSIKLNNLKCSFFINKKHN